MREAIAITADTAEMMLGKFEKSPGNLEGVPLTHTFNTANPPAINGKHHHAGDDVLGRCLKYLDAVPAAVEGQGSGEGSTQTLSACKAIAHFGLTGSDARAAFDHYNAKCSPPWTAENEINHKLADGLKSAQAEAGFPKLQERKPDPRKNGNRQGQNDTTRAKQANYGGSVSVSAWNEFPTRVLPGIVSEFVNAAASSINCDPSMIALPMLTAIGGAIGCTRYTLVKTGWAEPPVIWSAVIAESGSKKSPAMDAPTKAIVKQEMAHLQQFAEQMKVYEAALLGHKAALQTWQRNRAKSNEPMPTEPERPICKRFIVSDVTTEALAERLRDNPRGLLLKREELSGFLSSMNQYRAGGKGGDEAQWLSIYGARELVIDRKTSGKPTIFVPRAPVSIMGTIQPQILRKLLTRDHFESGMAARFLLANPPARVALWTEETIVPELEQAVGDMFFKLLRLNFATDDDGELVPEYLPLTTEAKRRFIEFHDEHANEAARLTGDLSAAWAKLCGYAARLALIVRFATWAQGNEFEQPKCIDLPSMESGITLARWFASETRRVYSLFSESDDHRQQRELIEVIQRHGGTITPRELMRACRSYATSEDAEQALQSLVNDNHGEWQIIPPGEAGGPASRRFTLSADADTTPAKQANNGGSVI